MDQGQNYYGGAQLLMLNFPQKQTRLMNKDFLNAFCLVENQQGQVIITSSGNPCTLEFTSVVFHKQSNTLNIKSQVYKHKCFINAIAEENGIICLRGEAGMDGTIYLAIANGLNVKVIAKKQQRDVTHVNFNG